MVEIVPRKVVKASRKPPERPPGPMFAGVKSNPPPNLFRPSITAKSYQEDVTNSEQIVVKKEYPELMDNVAR